MNKIPKNIRVLGWVSFFTDVSSEMILPILPLFLKNVLKTTMTSIGLIEGVAEATASLLKVASGAWSDRARRRKPFVLVGYGLSTLVKPLLAFTTTWVQVLGIRFADRVGKGIRTSPRDALIADTSATNSRGRSFGFHRSMDTLGAAVGTLLAFFLLSWKVQAYRLIFALSVLPGLTAVLLLIFLLKESPKKQTEAAPSGTVWLPFHDLPPKLWLLLGILSLFTFANVSYAFFILKINQMGISAAVVPLVYLFYNLIYAGAALPFGSLSDKLGRQRLLLFGFFLMTFLLWGFAQATSVWQAWALFFVYGLTSAITETVPRAMIADWSKQASRGSALGLYHTVVGLSALPASLIFGAIWNRYGATVAFRYGTLVAAGALLLLVLFGHLGHSEDNKA
jgi:MFS family permease